MMPIAHSGVNKTLGQYPQNEQYNRKGEGPSTPFAARDLAGERLLSVRSCSELSSLPDSHYSLCAYPSVPR